MKSISRFTLSFALMLCAAFAQMPGAPQFSADMTMTSQRMPDGVKGHIFMDKGKMRMDMNMQGRDMSMITDTKAQTSTMLMHERKMYMEMKAGGRGPMGRGPRMPDIKSFGENPCAGEEGVTCKKAGEETVNGRECDKWEFTSADPEKVRTAWIDKKLHFPVKQVSKDSTFEFTNIEEGAQDASHFEVPAGYQKFDPAMMMGGQGRGPGL